MFKKLRNKIGKKQQAPAIPDLHFNDNISAFEYACKYCANDIVPKQGLVGIVMTDPDITKGETPMCAVNVSSDDGGFVVLSALLAGAVSKVKSGDLVVWVPFQYNKEIADALGDERKGWVGYVVAKALPTLRTESGWDITERFTQ